jgi:hypothetical protein
MLDAGCKTTDLWTSGFYAGDGLDARQTVLKQLTAGTSATLHEKKVGCSFERLLG